MKLGAPGVGRDHHVERKSQLDSILKSLREDLAEECLKLEEEERAEKASKCRPC